ncbi:MAG: HAMP domain-containing histidine kinase [Peptostreptococcaceae bacterium]|nr:HAMP domain-containing histidine kinase [Peptostreptococcaceae bacterium]
MKSISKKIFINYMIIVFLGFIIISMKLSNSIEDYFLSQKENILLEQGKAIKNEYEKAYENGIIDFDKIKFELEVVNRYTNATVWMINNYGELYVISKDDDIKIKDKDLVLNELKNIFDGNIIKNRWQLKYFDEKVISVGYPVFYHDKVVAGILLHASIKEVQKEIGEIQKITILSLIFISIIGFLVNTIISKRIVYDIKKLIDGMEYISNGNFSKRLKINRNDEIGELAKNFNKMAEKLYFIEKGRKEFISNISHDFKSPLTSIKGFLTAILDGKIKKEEEEKYLKIALKESQRLSKLTESILNLNRIEDVQKLNKKIIHLDSLILNELDKLEQRIESKNLDINLNFEDKNNVFADEEYINRVISNLLDNAIKFNIDNGFINIITKRNNDKLYISIENKVDINRKIDINKIFERFYKQDLSRGEEKKGFGLGLCIVYEIINKHKEDIFVKLDEEKEKIIFTFTLNIK